MLIEGLFPTSYTIVQHSFRLNSTHITGISIQYIPKDVPTRPNGRVLIVEIEEILFFTVVGLMLRTDSEDACYEHIPLVKSGEDNQRIQLKNVD